MAVFLNGYDIVAWNYAAELGGITNTTARTIKTASITGERHYITALQIYADDLTTASELVIRDGSVGTVLWRSKITSEGFVQQAGITFPTALKGSINTLLEICLLTTPGAAVYFNAQGYSA